jgi:DNA-binding GntR family transcriptional regulator
MQHGVRQLPGPRRTGWNATDEHRAVPSPEDHCETARPAPSVEAIYERILNAVMEHRLPPGTKLIEEKLGAAFSVSRTKIRQVLGRLAHDGVATVYPNRGTFVSSPTVEEARHVLEARRLIEPVLIRQFADAGAKGSSPASAYVALESKARAASEPVDHPALGEFHMLIADMAATRSSPSRCANSRR